MPTVGVTVDAKKSIGTPAVAEPFLRFMKELGWEEGRNYHALFLWTERNHDRLPDLVRELVTQRVDVIVSFGNPAIDAAREATKTIPIVGLTDDMVKSGHVVNMAQPGGNVTGVNVFVRELDLKRFELIHELIPNAKRIGVLTEPNMTTTRAQLEGTAHDFNLELFIVNAITAEQVAGGLDALETAHLDGVIVYPSPILGSWRDLIIERLNQAHLPAIYQWPEYGKLGALLAYGPRLQLCFQQVAGMVVKILHGARPQDLPIEQPTKIDLVLNLKTAKAIGFTVPPSLLARADEVIE
jgi:putative tryptophan/tyrosine transport system substrate-binding protein